MLFSHKNNHLGVTNCQHTSVGGPEIQSAQCNLFI